MNFVGPKDVNLTDSGKVRFKENDLPSDVVWKYIAIRRSQLGLNSLTAAGCGRAEKSQEAAVEKPSFTPPPPPRTPKESPQAKRSFWQRLFGVKEHK